MPPVSRRTLLGAGLAGAGSAALGLWALQHSRRAAEGALPELLGPLVETPDETTGLPLLRLPAGFRYRTLSWAGRNLHDGHRVPGAADGMGVVAQSGSRVTLVRNHELRGSSGAIGRPEHAYDITGGGTSTLIFDTRREAIVDSWISLGGTLNNCAGGVTPWGTWLSCEEAPLSPSLHHLPVPARQAFWEIGNARREHGFVFQVPATGVAAPEPIVDMGQFYHEAVAFDPATGLAYLTEDAQPRAGFYRFTSAIPGDLGAGGRLEMMRVDQGRDMRRGVPPGEPLPVEWVPVDRPEQGFTPGNRVGDGVVAQGVRAGGSPFISLEGCVYDEERVYFTSKSAGRGGAGAVYEYDPGAEHVQMVYESPGNAVFSGPDNLVMSPRGGLVICEDRISLRKAGQSIACLVADGVLFRFCQINPDLRGSHAGHDLGSTARLSEWAGVTFSADGEWLFCNIYDPGVTVAITGPWQPGLV